MKSLREIRRRIRSVKNTQQITKAMEMVAAAKLRKAQERAEAARPYAEQMKAIISRLVSHMPNLQHQLLEKREVKNTGYLVIAADRGLCGGYNTGLLRFASGHIKDKNTDQILTIGKKARDYFRRRQYNLYAVHLDMEDQPGVKKVKDISQEAIKGFTDGNYDELYLAYTEFVNVVRQVPRIVKLLPMEPQIEEQEEVKKGAKALYTFEPGEEVIIDSFLPKYIEGLVYHAILEAKASEYGAKMTAMGSATENAQEMIESLTIVLNRARQATITQEILEICNTALALQ
ncbi:MAG: ATP synthase F1 subunit gamma [Firmicutes bacterium HGW-Firmicutes-13]|nr:MAG: ATP synthase F1 subunit gamma [Firmicutes bacterium HGW-Firmicutes-13]